LAEKHNITAYAVLLKICGFCAFNCENQIDGNLGIEMFRSIKTKIMVLQAGLILSVIICLGVISYLTSHSALKESQKQTLEFLADSLSERINDLIFDRGLLLERLADSEAITNYMAKHDDSALVHFFNNYRDEFPQLSYANSYGREELKVLNGIRVSNNFNLSNLNVYRQCVNTPNKVVAQYRDNCPDMGFTCMEFGYLYKNADESTGFVHGRVPISDLINDIQIFDKIKSTYAILVDAKGNIIACPDEDLILKKLQINGKASRTIISEINKNMVGYGRGEIFGKDSFLAYAPVKGQNWSVVIVLPYQNFIAKLRSLRNTIIILGLTILISGFFLSLYVATDITEPVLKLLKNTSVIASGDFTQRVSVESKDELGRLAVAFNKMTENLQKTTTSMVNLNHEIVERQKAEKTQQSLNEKLEKSIKSLTIANRELSDFAHVAAHDLKAPLRAIGSLAGIILDDYGSKFDEKGKYYVNTLIKRTERLSDLISGILTYSELGRSTIFMPVNINDVIRQTIINMDIPGNIDIMLESDFPTVFCSKTHMSQVFTNLIHNAIKFMDKPKGYIKLKCIEDGDCWIFSVSDNGRGIDEKYYDKIFKIFQTIVRRDEEENTGIGLSVVKRIIEKYNGKIWVESQPKVGSTFFFTLRKEKMEVNNEKLQTNSIS
jgi:signal transduction histidine kinase